MKTIYFLRHAECESNIKNAPYLGIDAKLTKKGIDDTKHLLPFFIDLNIDTIISSSAVRAVDTADIIAKSKKLSFVTTDLFLEREHPTELLGISHEDSYFSEVKQKVKKQLLQGKVFSDEESFSDLCRRADNFKSYLEQISSGNILVVGHGRFSKFFLMYLGLGINFTPEIMLQIDSFTKSRNLGLSEVEYNETSQEWKLRQWNASIKI